jgi:DNA-directed RNA polymerase subunit G
LELECRVEDITPLRIPRVYRVKGICEEMRLEIELHEDVIKKPSKNVKMIINITNSREICLNYYFCAHGYVLSNTTIGETHRAIISLHGLLVVLKSTKPIDLKSMEHVYIGIEFS